MPFSPDTRAFASDHREARTKFREACETRGIASVAFPHPFQGPEGDSLATDVAWIGSPNAKGLLIFVTGTHGSEALAGSGGQISWLLDDAAPLPDDVAVLMIHMLNPWGAAWGRRQTEGNVDLNRNFQDFAKPLPPNLHYEHLKAAFEYSSHDADSQAKAQAIIAACCRDAGTSALSAAVFQGQYSDPSGVGYGGNAATWANQTLHQILSKYAIHARTVAVVDIHTGFGPYGYGMPISSSEPGSAGLELAREWYGPSLNVLRDSRSKLPYDFGGDLCSAIETSLAPALVAPIALEFGTFGVDELLQLQIDDCWNEVHLSRDSEPARKTRERLKRFFYPATNDWLQMVEFRTRQIVALAILGLTRTARQ